MFKVTCQRCGFEWFIVANRQPLKYCKSCRAEKVKTVQGVRGKCYPWHGHFDESMLNPIDENGELVLPGRRICGNFDCINPSHIEGKK